MPYLQEIYNTFHAVHIKIIVVWDPVKFKPELKFLLKPKLYCL
jgi:hypothetical protein